MQTDTYKNIQFLLSDLENFKAHWSGGIMGVPMKVIAHYIKHGTHSSYRADQDVKPQIHAIEERLAKSNSENIWKAFENYCENAGKAIRRYREEIKQIDGYSPLKNAKTKSKRQAQRVIDSAFPRSTSEIFSASNGDSKVEIENEGRYNMSNLVPVPITWFKTIHLKGFSIIQSPKGKRFVMRCKPVDVQYVDEAGLNAWEVTVVGFNKKMGFTENGWMITHKSSDHDDLHPLFDMIRDETVIPHSFGESLSKAFNLMNRRTVRHLTKMMEN